MGKIIGKKAKVDVVSKRLNLVDKCMVQRPNAYSLTGGYSRLWHTVVDYISPSQGLRIRPQYTEVEGRALYHR